VEHSGWHSVRSAGSLSVGRGFSPDASSCCCYCSHRIRRDLCRGEKYMVEMIFWACDLRIGIGRILFIRSTIAAV
jgi:hypothetical protein